MTVRSALCLLPALCLFVSGCASTRPGLVKDPTTGELKQAQVADPEGGTWVERHPWTTAGIAGGVVVAAVVGVAVAALVSSSRHGLNYS